VMTCVLYQLLVMVFRQQIVKEFMQDILAMMTQTYQDGMFKIESKAKPIAKNLMDKFVQLQLKVKMSMKYVLLSIISQMQKVPLPSQN
jgi:flagellar motor component MotA